MTWAGEKVLVTGAGGFIGSHLVENLAAMGAQVRALVSYRSDSSWGWLDASPVKNDVEVVAGDVRDADSVTSAMRGCTSVFHLAALISIPYSYDAPMSYVSTNIGGTVNVLRAAHQLEVQRIVHTSTSETYGSARYVPMDEGHPLQGQSPYSASKIGADMMAEAFHRSFGLPVATVRPFNTYGPRQSARAIIPAIISQASNGSEIRLGSLTPTRDFNFVQDTVSGFIKAAESSEAIGQVINIGSGAEISIGQLAQLTLELMGKSSLPVVQEDQRVRPEDSEVNRLWADNSKAKEALGWAPQHTLREGLEATIEWVRSHLDSYRVESYVV